MVFSHVTICVCCQGFYVNSGKIEVLDEDDDSDDGVASERKIKQTRLEVGRRSRADFMAENADKVRTREDCRGCNRLFHVMLLTIFIFSCTSSSAALLHIYNLLDNVFG